MGVEKKKSKKKRVNWDSFITLACFIVSVFFLTNIFYDVVLVFNTRQQYVNTKVEYEQLKEDNEELTNQKNKLEDPKYVEQYVRQTYMLTKEGEKIFNLPRKNN